MKLKISPEEIQSNWDTFINNIEEYISEPRKKKMLQLYSDLEEIAIIAPAASSLNNHNCFPGGYIDHVNRVVEASKMVSILWANMGAKISFTEEELIFSAINHDLGKIGFPDNPNTIVNDNQWEVDKLKKVYKINPNNPFCTVPDRSLFLLQQYQITLTYNEFLGIKLHDGLYDESNKAYLISYMPESRLRTSLPIILHQADMMASRIEWENEWIDKLNNKK